MQILRIVWIVRRSRLRCTRIPFSNVHMHDQMLPKCIAVVITAVTWDVSLVIVDLRIFNDRTSVETEVYHFEQGGFRSQPDAASKDVVGSFPCRKYCLSSGVVEKDYTRPSNFELCSGIPDRFLHSTCAEFAKADHYKRQGSPEDNGYGSSKIIRQTGDRGGCVSSRRVHFKSIFGNQENRGLETGHKFKTSKRVCKQSSFQDGINSDSASQCKTRGLHDISGPKRCLFFRSDGKSPSKISEIYLEGPQIPVQMPALRPNVGPESFYQINEACDRSVTSPRNKNCNLFGRCVNPGKISRGMSSSYADDNRFFRRSGVLDQSREVLFKPCPDNSIPGLYNKYAEHDSGDSRYQMHHDNISMSNIDEERASTGKTGSKHYRTAKVSQVSRTPGYCVQQNYTESADISVKAVRSRLRSTDVSTSSSGSRIVNVGSALTPVERQTHLSASSRFHRSDRCVFNRLGGSVCECSQSCQRSVESQGTDSTYKCPRGKGNKIGDSRSFSFRQEDSYYDSDRQHNGHGIRESPRRNKISTSECRSDGIVEMVSGQGDNFISHSHPRSKERSGRFFVKDVIRSRKLVPGQHSLPETPMSPALCARCRPFCLQRQSSARQICNVASRSAGMEDGCPIVSMDRSQTVHFSSICVDRSSGSEDSSRSSRQGPSDRTNMGFPSMVSDSSKHVNPRASDFAGVQPATSSSAQQSTSSARGKSTVSRVDCVRSHLAFSGISGQSADLILASWRKGTERQYSSAWRVWNRWCNRRKEDPVQAPLKDICEFLSHLYNKGLSYATINTYRSAISMTHVPIDGVRAGQHFIICRLLKGIFHSRPPVPKYVFSWPVGQVFRYLKSLQSNKSLPFKLLSMKTVLLVALVSADRGSSIAAYNINFMVSTPTVCRFLLAKLAKTTRPGAAVREVIFRIYKKDIRICPVSSIREYINRTKTLRGDEGQLFISLSKPHKAVVPATLARWIVNLLKLAGIDTDIFKAHSTRGAATSQAMRAGLPLADIVKAGDWSSAVTFQKYYNKPLSNKDFMQAVLD